MPIIVSPKRKRKKNLGVNRKTYSTLGTVFLGLAGLAFLLFGSGVFMIENINIQGMEEQEVPALKTAIDSYLDQGDLIKRRSNTLLVDLEDLRMDILKQVPKVKSVELKRNSLKGLLVDVMEKEPKGIYCADTCYYFDSEGVIYDSAPRTKGYLVLSVSDKREISVEEGDTVLDKKLLESIYEANNLFEDILKISIEEYIIPSNSFDEFQAKTEEGWLVYMATDSTQTQMEDLKLFLENKFRESRENLIYIDIRLEGRVYYKEK